MAPGKARFRQYCYLPCQLVDINSYENLLSFERNFVPLHLGTILVGYCMLFSLQLQKYNPIIIVPTFSCFFCYLFRNNLHVYGFIRIFAAQPDEETGSAEEQPASNMAVPTLEAVFQEPSYPWAAH
jgi:hypothetical protein